MAAGWAIDLYLGERTRDHDDIEISTTAGSFGEIADALTDYEWDVIGDGRVWRFPDALASHHQTWLRDPDTGDYLLDVFREPHEGRRWICRRDRGIVLDVDELFESTEDGIPYVIPEVVVLFKARHTRPKDVADFEHVVKTLPAVRRQRLAGWLRRIEPGHEWISALSR